VEFYDVLGVRKGASTADIRRAFQKLARRLHPDLNPGDPVACERFRVVSQAFQVLVDVQRRAAYDRGEAPPPTTPPTPEVGFEGFDFSAEVRAEKVGFRELFGGEPERPARAEPTRGEDIEQRTRLGFDESLSGATRRVHLVRQDHCPICRGAGDVAFGPVPCPRCNGSGQLRASRGRMIFSRRCPDCGAAGRLSRRPCARCLGQGRLIQSEWLDVEIPAGVADGTRIRIPGCGNAGPCGGPAGDFVLAVEVEPHPLFRREGQDLHCLVAVTAFEAAAGAHVQVATPDGPMTIEIPAGTQPGQRFRLRKRGLPKVGEKGRGDLWVETRLVVPAVTDDRGRELLRELALLHPQDPRAAQPAGSKA
jgi:molecular chaperone DnaJ